MRDDEPVAGDGLLHPVPLLAIALLLVNDHWAKSAYEGFVTGKLSDVAGLVFFPLMLQAALEVAQSRLRGEFAPSWRLLVGCVVATGLVFSAVQLWPPASEVYRWGLGALQWPFRAVYAAFAGAPVPSVAPVALVADPKDLLALPALALALWAGRGRTAGRPPDRVESDRR